MAPSGSTKTLTALDGAFMASSLYCRVGTSKFISSKDEQKDLLRFIKEHFVLYCQVYVAVK